MRKMILLVAAGVGLVFLGCNKAAEKAPEPDAHGHQVSAPQGTGHDVNGWCVEHGVPEAICSLCNSKVAAELKKAGDWCNEHSRAESQCFICDPTRKEKFAAQYETIFGKKPPQ
ncbi:MAG: hypothetical protein LBJ00_01910 [Planctomycetaceae bacterium]|nr:hypothetical protein [Planctomycetaceae bacterium]